MQIPAIHVNSEIGRLKKVMLHRPGQELENLMPEYLERLLFDDIPYLRIAQEEHNSFADILRQNGVEVVYLSDLVAESIINQDVKEQLISELIDDASITTSRERDIDRLFSCPGQQDYDCKNDGRYSENRDPAGRRQKPG